MLCLPALFWRSGFCAFIFKCMLRPPLQQGAGLRRLGLLQLINAAVHLALCLNICCVKFFFFFPYLIAIRQLRISLWCHRMACGFFLYIYIYAFRGSFYLKGLTRGGLIIKHVVLGLCLWTGRSNRYTMAHTKTRVLICSDFLVVETHGWEVEKYFDFLLTLVLHRCCHQCLPRLGISPQTPGPFLQL